MAATTRESETFDLWWRIYQLPYDCQAVIFKYFDDVTSITQIQPPCNPAPTERSGELLWELPLEVRKMIYGYFLPEPKSVITIKGDGPGTSAGQDSDATITNVNRDRTLSDDPSTMATHRELRQMDSFMEQKSKQQQYQGIDNALTLLLVNSRMCHEVSTMLYDELTFELDLSEAGVRFLNLPTVPRLEQYGLALEHGNSKFGKATIGSGCNRDSNWIFSFSRIKKLVINIWGGCVKQYAQVSTNEQWRRKQKCLEMRQNLQKLVELLKGKANLPDLTWLQVNLKHGRREALKKADPPAGQSVQLTQARTLTVIAMNGGLQGTIQLTAVNMTTDNDQEGKASFWYTDDSGNSPRCSLLGLEEERAISDMQSPSSNENFILQPLEALRGVHTCLFRREVNGWIKHVKKPWMTKKMQSTEPYSPDQGFQRHVSQMEEALDDWLYYKSVEIAKLNKAMERVEDSWIDERVESWCFDQDKMEEDDFDDNDDWEPLPNDSDADHDA